MENQEYLDRMKKLDEAFSTYNRNTRKNSRNLFIGLIISASLLFGGIGFSSCNRAVSESRNSERISRYENATQSLDDLRKYHDLIKDGESESDINRKRTIEEAISSLEKDIANLEADEYIYKRYVKKYGNVYYDISLSGGLLGLLCGLGYCYSDRRNSLKFDRKLSELGEIK